MSFLEKSKKNERKALVRVLQMDGKIEKDDLGFGVKTKKREGAYCFITSASVLRSPLSESDGMKIVADRYCSKYPDHIDQEDHRIEVFKVKPSVNEDISFAFCNGGREDEFLEVDDGTFLKRLPIIDTLRAYVFEGKKIIELIFEYEHSNEHFEPKNLSGFPSNRAKGAPIIAKDLNSEELKVVGILCTKSDGNLYPVFLTPSNLKVPNNTKSSTTVERKKEIPTTSDDEKPGNIVQPMDETDKPIHPTDLQDLKNTASLGKKKPTPYENEENDGKPEKDLNGKDEKDNTPITEERGLKNRFILGLVDHQVAIVFFTVSCTILKGSCAFAPKRACNDRDIIIVQGVEKGLYHCKLTVRLATFQGGAGK